MIVQLPTVKKLAVITFLQSWSQLLQSWGRLLPELESTQPLLGSTLDLSWKNKLLTLPTRVDSTNAGVDSKSGTAFFMFPIFHNRVNSSTAGVDSKFGVAFFKFLTFPVEIDSTTIGVNSDIAHSDFHVLETIPVYKESSFNSFSQYKYLTHKFGANLTSI